MAGAAVGDVIEATATPRAAPAPPEADRFRTPASTLLVDRSMTWAIRLGGASVIVAVLGIFAFIVWQIVPLFQGARVAAAETLQAPAGEALAIGIDEWGERPFVAYRDGTIAFLGASGVDRRRLLPEGTTPTSVQYTLR